MNCNGVIGKDCDECNEPCIFKFTDEEWKAYKRYSVWIVSALQERDSLQRDIDDYWNLKRELNKEGLMVEDVINIDLNSLRRQKREVETRIRKLRKAELYYTKQLLERQKGG